MGCVTSNSWSTFGSEKRKKNRSPTSVPKLERAGDVKVSKPYWPRGQNFGLSLGLGLDKLASASSIWPRPGLGLVNFAPKMYPMQDNKNCLYPFRGCIIATFITKT